jgi:hypothetical protein
LKPNDSLVDKAKETVGMGQTPVTQAAKSDQPIDYESAFDALGVSVVEESGGRRLMNAIMAVMRFPIDFRKPRAIGVRTTAALFAGQLLKPVVQRRIGISAVAVAAMGKLDGQQHHREDGA